MPDGIRCATGSAATPPASTTTLTVTKERKTYLPLQGGSFEVRGELATAATAREAMLIEARAAVAYWDGWAAQPMTFARADVGRVPEYWLVAGERRSAISMTSPRNATTPAQACLNYGYALAEFACKIALQANGLDPDIGWHARSLQGRDRRELRLSVGPGVESGPTLFCLPAHGRR
jgi:hypothetical protein